MANVLTFRLKKEVQLKEDLTPDGEESVALYACIDGIWAHVSDIDTIEDAKELIKPEHVESSLSNSLSDVEYEHIMGVLEYHPEYYFFNEVYNYKEV